MDSVLAQDVYDALTDKGYRVFFSRISLEDKLGVEYEPYIFAALNSAKIMLAFGTDYEYFNAVWVKNEWSRFLKLMAKDKDKHLIPCYKGIDAYDMPKEFAKLQAQDLGKVGAIQDLLRGIDKLLPRQAEVQTVVPERVVTAGNPSIESYLKRVFIFLDDGDWKSANEYCEKVLDIDPECAQAYLGKLMAELKVNQQEQLQLQPEPFNNSNHFNKILRYGNDDLRNTLSGYLTVIRKRKEEQLALLLRKEAERIARQAQEEENKRAERARQEAEERRLAELGMGKVVFLVKKGGLLESANDTTYKYEIFCNGQKMHEVFVKAGKHNQSKSLQLQRGAYTVRVAVYHWRDTTLKNPPIHTAGPLAFNIQKDQQVTIVTQRSLSNKNILSIGKKI